MESIIEVKNLSVYYGQTEALKDVSFAIKKGDFIGIAGPNGGGKTTLVKTILGLISSYNGVIKIMGKSLDDFDFWGKIGYLPQKSSSINALFPATVNEIVTLGFLSQKRIPKRVNKNDNFNVKQILEKLGIYDLRNKVISELSGGQQQKVLLARALVSNPEILIFDEPSTALDPVSRDSFFNLVKKLNKESDIAIILITHDTGYIGSYANKLMYLDHKLEYYGEIEGFCLSDKDNHSFEKNGNHIIWHQHK